MMKFSRTNYFGFFLMVFTLIIANNGHSQCGGCTISYGSYGGNVTVSTGQTVCINPGATMSGQVILSGGVLCNEGTINNLRLNGGAGRINNYGTITDTETGITFSGKVYIYAYSSSQLNFSSVSINMSGADSLYFNVENGGSVYFSDDLSISSKKLSIDNSGSFQIDKKININAANLFIYNRSDGIFNMPGGSINLSNSGQKKIVNQGSFTASGGINVGGDGTSTTTVVIENSDYLSVGYDLNCSMINGSFKLISSATNTPGIDIQRDLILNETTNTVVNSGYLTIGRNIITNNGGVNNSGTVTCAGSMSVSGTFTNSSYITASTIIVSSTGTVTNNALINSSSSFSNSGTINMAQTSDLNLTDYYNLGTGSINGPSSASSFTQFASILISGTSQNNSYLTGKIKVFDQSLISTTLNVGYGFDAVSSATRIASTVNYLSTSVGPSSNPSITVDCAGLANYYFLNIGKEQYSQCPGSNVLLFPQMYFSPAGLTNTVNATPVGLFGTSASATWQPGNIATLNYNVTPSVTTTYTLTLKLPNGCTYTQTITVPIFPITFPTISYSTTPYLPTSNVTFSVNQTGPTGGTYSASPTLSINATTGLITPTASAYGTYTVSYTISNPGGYGCSPYTATTVVTLTDLRCPVQINGKSPLLCEGEKMKLIAVGGVDGYTWTPVTGLSCTNCATPTVTAGSVTTIYTISSTRNGVACGSTTLDVKIRIDCDKEELVGCCFSNYGTSVTVNSDNTYINVYCNVVNELGIITNTVTKGQFNNLGTIQVLLYWIHNAKNNLYTTTNGVTRFFGADQKIKGNSNTWFNDMHLEGNGIKSIWIDEYNTNNLYLYSNVLSIQNYNFFMKNNAATISRTTGYASTGLNGYFSAALNSKNSAPTKTYLYPLGASASSVAPFRYRPLVMANNTNTLGDEISANFMNTAPSLTNDPVFVNSSNAFTNNVTNTSPSVVQINNAFYHKLKNTITPTSTVSNLNVKSYYFLADGSFQSLAEWEKDPAQYLDWWGTTPGASASYTVSTDPGTPGMIYAQTNGTLNFNGKPFTLSKGGFFVNTSPFGNGNGTIMTLTASPSSNTNMPTPSGGGLNNSYGTGPASGNSGNGGPTVFAPNPVAGDYVMTVLPANDCAVPGKMKFTIDQNGNIDPASVLYGLTTGTNYLGELSQDVYAIDNINSGITFSASPKNILANCINSITVSTSVGNDFVFDKSLVSPVENIKVYIPGNMVVTLGTFKIYNSANTFMNSPGNTLIGGTTNIFTIANPSSYPVGVYTFKFNVSYMHPLTLQTINEDVKGQFIIK